MGRLTPNGENTMAKLSDKVSAFEKELANEVQAKLTME